MKTETIIIRDNPNVTVTIYLHDVYPGMDSVNERPAVLILPGGGYRMCSDSEAEPIALAYMAEGFQAFVLRYSVGEDAQFPQPLQDAEEALNLIQNNALAWHVKDQQIAVVGFSAGGTSCCQPGHHGKGPAECAGLAVRNYGRNGAGNRSLCHPRHGSASEQRDGTGFFGGCRPRSGGAFAKQFVICPSLRQ